MGRRGGGRREDGEMLKEQKPERDAEGRKSGFGEEIEKRRAWKGAQRMIRSSEGQGGADKQGEEGKKRWKKGKCMKKKGIRMSREETHAS